MLGACLLRCFVQNQATNVSHVDPTRLDGSAWSTSSTDSMGIKLFSELFRSGAVWFPSAAARRGICHRSALTRGFSIAWRIQCETGFTFQFALVHVDCGKQPKCQLVLITICFRPGHQCQNCPFKEHAFLFTFSQKKPIIFWTVTR